MRRVNARERQQDLIANDRHEFARVDAANRHAGIAAAQTPRRDRAAIGNIGNTNHGSDHDLVGPAGDGIAEHDPAAIGALQRQLVQLREHSGCRLRRPRRCRVLGEQTVALTGRELLGAYGIGQNARLGKEAAMEKRPYNKPALTTLGLLRKLTQFSF